MAYRIATIPGDGIGSEVVEQALRVLEATGVEAQPTYFNLGAARYNSTGEVLPDAELEDIRGYDGDLLGLQPRSDPPGEPAAVQRLRLDGTVVWTHAFPDASVDILDIEVGPTGSIVATGAVPFGDPRAVLLSMDPNGAIVWTIEHIPEAPSTATYLITAFGPGFLAVAGLDYTYTMENYTLDRLWVQRRGG